MKIKQTIATLLLCSLAWTASATDLGVLGPQPHIQTLTIGTPDVSFATKYFFSLLDEGAVSASANSLSLVLGGKTQLGIADFSLELFDASNQLLTSATLKDNSYRIDDFSLKASNYYFLVSGQTQGLYGGSYTFAAVDSVHVSSVPEPGSLMLLGVGMLVVGINRLVANRKG